MPRPITGRSNDTATPDKTTPLGRTKKRRKIKKEAEDEDERKVKKYERVETTGPENAAVAELQARIDRAKASVGPVHINPGTFDYLSRQNRDIEALTLTQLEHEMLRLQARMSAVKDRIVHLQTTKTKVRTKCSADGCTNLAQKGGVCRRHGAPFRKKVCEAEGCGNQAQRGGVCYSHGAKYKLCTIEGCTNKIQRGGLCCRHGANLKECDVGGCRNLARKGGRRCQKHKDVSRDDDEEEELKRSVMRELAEEEEAEGGRY